MRIKHVFGLILILLMISGVGGQYTELVTNGEFEVNANGWTPGFSATLTGGTANPASGVGCLTITENGEANPYANQDFVSTAGKRYKFHAYIKQGTEATYRILLYSDGFTLLFDTGENEAGASWARLESEFVALDALIRISIYQICASGAGTNIYLDQVSLQECPTQDPIAGWGASIVTNGDFTVNVDGWNHANGAMAYVAGPTFGRANVASATTNGNGWSAANQWSVFTDVRRYLFSCWYYIPSGNTSTDQIYVQTVNGDTVAIATLTTLDAWTYGTGEFIASASNTKLYLYHSDGGVLNSNTNGDVFYLDEVRVREVPARVAIADGVQVTIK